MKDQKEKKSVNSCPDWTEEDMEILVADKAGFCLGVERALNTVLYEIGEGKNTIYTYGPLIHNPQVVKYLKSLGVKVAKTIDEIPDYSHVVVRSHGIGPSTYKEMEAKHFNIIDATCMFVKKAQRIVREMYDEGYTILILGLKDHPEVVALRDFLKKQVPNLAVRNTICDATMKRQIAAREIAGKVDAMIVIGGLRSSNTRKLTDICRDRGVDTYHIETPDELKKGWLLGRRRIGVTAGASTPDWLIEEVIKALREFGFKGSVFTGSDDCEKERE
ncbi:MAG: 4-hydroxy-3-methylbut-2-enyl diphosphate reductase [bacterium]|nr:4-hydroxy-3-methylbut-2-enyl diphosphate reductase [bacterium]